MPQEGFPSQDPEQLAKVLASDAYHTQKAEEAQRRADEAAAETARQTQEQRLEKWFTGDQTNAKDLKDYLASRPYEDEKGIHAPTGEMVEPVDAVTWGRKQRVPNQWGNRYFEGKRSERYEQTHDDPAALSAFHLFDDFIKAEIHGNKTFMKDYGKILDEKLSDRNVTAMELADLQAEAENDAEIHSADVSQTTKLLNKAIDARVTDFHNRNLGKVKGPHEMHDADGKLRTVTAMEYGAARTDAYRARIMKEKEDYLAVLRAKRPQQNIEEIIEKMFSPQSTKNDGDEEPRIKDDLDDYMPPDWVMSNGGETPDDAQTKADVETLKAAGDARRQAQAAEAPAAEEAKAEETQTAETEVIEPEEPEAVSQTPEDFQAQLAIWSKRLQDSRFVPTPEQYEDLADFAVEIEFLHDERKLDGSNSMGYFFGNTRLNAYQARTILDKTKPSVWVFVDDDEKAIAERASHFIERQGEDMTGILNDAAEWEDGVVSLMTPNQFFQRLAKDLGGKISNIDEPVARYQDYLDQRIELDDHLRSDYAEEELYPSLVTRGAAKDYEELESKKRSRRPHRIAINGLRSFARKRQEAREKRRQQSRAAPETEEWLTEERDNIED